MTDYKLHHHFPLFGRPYRQRNDARRERDEARDQRDQALRERDEARQERDQAKIDLFELRKEKDNVQNTIKLLGRTGPHTPASVDRLLQTILDVPLYYEALELPLYDDGTLDHLALCFGQAPQFGHVLEFGVASGKTIRCLACLAPHRIVWGFDSFQGLPEDWAFSSSKVAPAGTFSTGGVLPDVPSNVKLVKGWFNETVPDWLSKHSGNISFLHVDVDLYSSTAYILETLNDRIVPGTIIVWDDLGLWDELRNGNTGNYERWQLEEWRGMTEWLTRFNREIAPFCRGWRHMLGTRIVR